MNKDRNYNVYIKGMKQGNAEKLFFLDHLELYKFDTIIDFGCGSGDIIEAISKFDDLAHVRLIGIDSDDYMRTLARTTNTNSNAWFYAELNKSMITDKTLIIFSSVLHEVGEYWETLKNIIKNTGATLVIRDMKCGVKYKYGSSKKNFAKLVANSNPKRLAQFVEKYGMDDTAILHYLLKYAYIDNWDLELQEDYFSTPWEDFEKLGEVIFKNEYILDFKKQQVKKDFDIDLAELTNYTHCQMIVKIKKAN